MAPRILSNSILSDEEVEHQLQKGYGAPIEIDTATLILCRNLQGQINALQARIEALETP